jgi:hypothetical protein
MPIQSPKVTQEVPCMHNITAAIFQCSVLTIWYLHTLIVSQSTTIDDYAHLVQLFLFLLFWLYSPLLGSGRFFSFLVLYAVSRTPWTGNQPVSRLLPIHRTAQTQNKRTQTSMPWVGFEPTTPAFEWEKRVHALDLAATVIGPSCSNDDKFI